LGLATPYRDFSLFRIYADKKTTVQQNIQKTMPYIQNTSYLFLDGVAEDDFTLVLVIQEKTNEFLSSHRTNCKRTQSCKIEIDKALKVADGFMQDNATKFSMPLNMLVLLIIGKNGLKPRTLKKSNAVAVKERPKSVSAKKLPKLVKKEYGTLS
jgi:hypothetical protein